MLATVRLMSHKGSPTATAVHRLKQEIDRLSEQQSEALKMATFFGMTSHEAKEYDARRTQITRLVRELRMLEGPQGSLRNETSQL